MNRQARNSGAHILLSCKGLLFKMADCPGRDMCRPSIWMRICSSHENDEIMLQKRKMYRQILRGVKKPSLRMCRSIDKSDKKK